MSRNPIELIEQKRVLPGCWPTENQELLLKACLFKEKHAIKAWKEWKYKIDIDSIDEGSIRLLPLLYHHRHTLGIEDPILTKAKEIYLRVLAKNHLMFHRAIPIFKKLQEEGIELMLLKGAALTLLHYKNFAIRPQLDIDILVKPENATKAFEILKKENWKPAYEFPMKTILNCRHSCGFDGGAEKQLDLHWSIHIKCREENADEVFWKKAVPVQFNDLFLQALNPSHQIFVDCIHGIRWDTRAPCRWVADVMTLVNSPEVTPDWDEIANLAIERKIVMPLLEGMRYLNHHFEANIPEKTISKLEKTPTSSLNRIEFYIHTHNKSKIFGHFFNFALDYLHLSQPKGFFKKLFFFPKYLQVCWQVENLWIMPFTLVAESVKTNLKRPK